MVAFGAGADPRRELGHDEEYGLIHQLKHRALVDLVIRNRLGNLCALEKKALDLRGDKKTLGLLAEEQNRRMAWLPTVEQVQVGQRLLGRRPGTQRVVSLVLGAGEEVADLLSRKIVDCGIQAGRCVERAVANGPGPEQILDEAGIHQRSQFRDAIESSPDELAASLAHESLHLGVALGVLVALDEDQAMLPGSGSPVELAFRGRESLGVFVAIFVAEQPQIDGTSVHLFQIDLLGAAVGGGQVLEKEHFEEPAQEGISLDVVLQRPALGGQFLLHAADEYQGFHGRRPPDFAFSVTSPMISASSPSVSLFTARMSARISSKERCGWGL